MQGAAFCDFRYTYASNEPTTASGGDAMTDTPTTDEAPEEAPQTSEEPRRSHIKRGTGTGVWRGDGDAQAAFTERVRQAAEAARAASEGHRPAVEQAAREAKERAGRAAEAARPHIEQAAQGAANFAKEHQSEIKSAALRAARIAARLTVPPRVREAFEAELHRDDPKPTDTPEPPTQS
jgi:membrane protein involved in colicin uptake